MNNSAMPSSLTVVFSAVSGDKNTIPVNSTPETLADGLAGDGLRISPLTRIVSICWR
ncbi:hypothetical protein [Klebsiella pneumoniae]|uniref:hypothetical protein n=1 Tax=Klebsiella pneumoniae TaxID=573 RepID=UPI0032AEB148